MKRIFTLMTALGMVFGFTVSAQATLIDRGGGLIFDDDRNITWLQDANYAQTSGFDLDGKMIWDDAQTFVAAMNAGTIGNFGFTDWRLPTALNQDGTDPCLGFTCTGSEMGHLHFLELMNGNTLLNAGPFMNLQINSSYWSGTALASDPTLAAWEFAFFAGLQDASIKANLNYAFPVRPGDVTAAVPEPGTLLLLGNGLVGLAACRKWLRRLHG